MTPLISELFGTELPLIQAPMAGVQDSALAIAVCNAGGLGSLPAAMLDQTTLCKELAAIEAPERFVANVMVGPSPSFINDGEYVGGFTRSDIDGLLETLESNYLGWSSTMAPAIMGSPDQPELGVELTNSFCRTDPEIAKHFARTTFLSDHRSDLPAVSIPTLLLQCSQDVIAPLQVGEYMHRVMPGSELVVLKATGHCPNLSAPAVTISAIKNFL